MVQLAPVASVPHVVVAAKLEAPVPLVVATTVPICCAAPLVLVSVTLCWVAVGPGTLLKTSAVGFSEAPGSGEPYPVNEAVAKATPACKVSVPVSGPAVVGAYATSTKQDAV
jgi:hypothetical protein